MNIKKQDLKRIIKECIVEVITEMKQSQDPTKEEMMAFLQSQFGREEEFENDAEVAIYWFATFNHGGQSSNLYSVSSTSQYRPGPIAKGPQKDSMEEMMYQALEQKFGSGEQEQNPEETSIDEAGTEEDKNPLYVEYDSQRSGEEPFMMSDGKKYEYVNAIYPGQKKDIGVYSFAGDMVYSYDAFRKMFNINEDYYNEGFDPQSNAGPNGMHPENNGFYQSEINKMKKLEETDSQVPNLKTFEDIRNELDPDGTKHDLTLKCAKCGTQNTCRCSKPKRTVIGICPECFARKM